MLSLQNVSHSYRNQPALSDVSVELAEGVTALIGVNGAGKSTLLNIAAGGLRPTTGVVRSAGLDVFRRATRGRALRKVALMPQSATFPGNMTAREIVEYAAWMRGASARQARLAATDALKRVLLADRAGDKMRNLSGGMQRRVCLAQAIASDAEVLLLDEPSTGLDPEQRRVMVDRLRELAGTILLSSHVMEDVTELASRVLVLDAGSLVFDGSLDTLKGLAGDPTSPQAAEAGFLAVLTSRRGVAR